MHLNIVSDYGRKEIQEREAATTPPFPLSVLLAIVHETLAMSPPQIVLVVSVTGEKNPRHTTD